MTDFVAGAMPLSSLWRSVAYGAGTFVSVAYNRSIAATSPDGLTWTQRTLPITANWRTIAYGNGTFVAMAYLSTVAATSPDGITWTQRSILGSNGYWRSLAFGNGVFVAVSETNSNVAATSPDGITWTQRTLPATAIWSAVAFGNGVFVATASGSSAAATSPDGITWTERAMPASRNWGAVTFGAGLFVALANGSAVAATSPDGVTWTERTLPVSSAWYTVAYGGALFIAIAQNSTAAATSPDGITWTSTAMPSSLSWYGVVHGGDRFVAVANSTATMATYEWVAAAEAPGGVLLAPSPLRVPAVLANVPLFARAYAPSPLGAPAARAAHDFTGQLGDAVTLYVMDLITPTGTVRVPISSWQATLQTGSSNYVQCVVPAVQMWVDAINAATEFVIYRKAVLPDGSALEYEMARAPTQQAQFDRGPSRYTCTLSGYTDAFAADLDPPVVFDRVLTGIRSVSSGSSMRVRCAVDWLLRPGHRAYAEGTPLVVGYINYYAPSGDSYMDVGEQT